MEPRPKSGLSEIFCFKRRLFDSKEKMLASGSRQAPSHDTSYTRPSDSTCDVESDLVERSEPSAPSSLGSHAKASKKRKSAPEGSPTKLKKRLKRAKSSIHNFFSKEKQRLHKAATSIPNPFSSSTDQTSITATTDSNGITPSFNAASYPSSTYPSNTPKSSAKREHTITHNTPNTSNNRPSSNIDSNLDLTLAASAYQALISSYPTNEPTSHTPTGSRHTSPSRLLRRSTSAPPSIPHRCQGQRSSAPSQPSSAYSSAPKHNGLVAEAPVRSSSHARRVLTSAEVDAKLRERGVRMMVDKDAEKWVGRKKGWGALGAKEEKSRRLCRMFLLRDMKRNTNRVDWRAVEAVVEEDEQFGDFDYEVRR